MIPRSDCKEIMELCGYCPLAIRTICSTLNSGHIMAKQLIVNLQVGKQVSSVLNTRNCLQQTFTRLSDYYQRRLLCLSLFGTAKFSLDDASAILGRSKERKEDYATVLDLVYLKSQHLLEITEDAYDEREGRENKYSLHPLMHRFLSEVQTEDEFQKRFQTEMERAKERFILHFYNTAMKMSDRVKKDPKKFIVMVDLICHLRKFYDYLKSVPAILDQKTSVDIGRLADLSSMVMSNEDDKRDLYDTLCEHTSEQGNLVELIRWKTHTARLLFEQDEVKRCQAMCEEIQTLLQENKAELESKPGWKPVCADYLVLLVRFDGFKLGRLDDALKHLQNACCLYEAKEVKPDYKSDLANAYNSRGCLYYKLDEWELSKKFHEKAYKMGSDARNESNFLANIGTCCLALGQKFRQSDTTKALSYLEEARNSYDLALSREIKEDDRKARKMINRSKLYRLPEMENFEQGWDDMQAAVVILERVLKPPHDVLTKAYIDKADFLRHWAENFYKVDKDKGS